MKDNDRSKGTHPPIPQELGSVTLSAAEVATAASAELFCVKLNGNCVRFLAQFSPALPPFLRISKPASVARGWDEATTPFVPKTTDLRLENGVKTSSGRSTLDQSTRDDIDSEHVMSFVFFW